VDAAGESDLHHEPASDRYNRDVGQERRDGILAGTGGFGHHVHLLLDDGGASGGHSDDKRESPQ
jgi:hypothetical protein